MSRAMENLLAILDLERLEMDLFRGVSPKVGWQRVFGGQVIAQSLVAAQRTIADDRFVHSLHSYFMRPGDPEVPIIYEVDRIRDGVTGDQERGPALDAPHRASPADRSCWCPTGRPRTSCRTGEAATAHTWTRPTARCPGGRPPEAPSGGRTGSRA